MVKLILLISLTWNLSLGGALPSRQSSPATFTSDQSCLRDCLQTTPDQHQYPYDQWINLAYSQCARYCSSEISNDRYHSTTTRRPDLYPILPPKQYLPWPEEPRPLCPPTHPSEHSEAFWYWLENLCTLRPSVVRPTHRPVPPVTPSPWQQMPYPTSTTQSPQHNLEEVQAKPSVWKTTPRPKDDWH